MENQVQLGCLMQPNELFYSEKQRFRQWWLWRLILILSPIGPVVFLWAIFQQVIIGSPIGNNPTGDCVLIILGLIFVIGFGIGIPLLMYTTGIDTEVRESGVFIRFRPFHRKWVGFGFESIQIGETLTYSPLKDYGGWGIRYGRKGKAYNVSGNKGVLLTLKDRKNVLIGSKNHEALCSSITERARQRMHNNERPVLRVATST